MRRARRGLAAWLAALTLLAGGQRATRSAARELESDGGARQQPPGEFLDPALTSPCAGDPHWSAEYAEKLLGGCGRPSADGWPMALPAESLAGGVRTLGGERVIRLVRRLEAGHPVTVLALGGSVTQSAAGCWGAGCKQDGGAAPAGSASLWLAEGGVRNRKQHSAQYSPGAQEPARPMFDAWLARFMQYLNSTFPHPDHAAFNEGMGAGNPSYLLSCPADFMLPEADLVVIDYAVNGGARGPVQEVLAHVMRLPKQPAVLLANMYWWCRDEDGSRGTRALGKGLCSDQMRSPNRTLLSLARPGLTAELTALAREWGLGSISIFHALMPLMLRSPKPPTPLADLSGVLDDMGLHPARGASPSAYSIYISDLLVHWLRAAKTLQTGSIDAHAVPPFTFQSSVVKCYDWWMHTRPRVVSNAGAVAGVVPEAYRGMELGADEFSDGFGSEPHNASAAWFFASHPLDGPDHVRARFKPSLASVAVGAAVELGLSLAHVASYYRSHVTDIAVQYFSSYENVGVAVFECAGGCRCNPLLVDALNDQGFSGPREAVLPLEGGFGGGGRECMVRVTNAERGDGRPGSKFRLLKVSVRSEAMGDVMRQAEEQWGHRGPA